MGTAVTAADANRDFSKLLRAVRDGDSFVITSHGKPIAKIIPFTTEDRVRAAAKKRLIAHLRAQPIMNIGRWTRDELYERD
ncbi:MAG TPA: type II toxin-antitoxin system prevent-host-death family antitoxin [Vicinamibacterales bacterium]|jgi:prevent-host-death family protein|nr:type II toxin-antitoxin system prevent-host-death family antitoxin [Vicinamibacterales bacterium]